VFSLKVLWLVKDDYIGNTFFDASASSFILPELRYVQHLAQPTCSHMHAPLLQYLA
jgi:hypothetical protein